MLPMPTLTLRMLMLMLLRDATGAAARSWRA